MSEYLVMLRVLMLSWFLFKWYLRIYFIYFWVIFALSFFDVKLGFTEKYVQFMNRVFEYVEESREMPPFDDEKKRPSFSKNSPFLAENDIHSQLYNDAVVKNRESPKYASTIQRKIILLPEFENKILSTIEDDEVLFSESSAKVYELSDIAIYVRAGIEAIVEDQITSKFESEKLEDWNLLTRNNPHIRFYNWKIVILWFIGLLFRYFILFPVRFLNCILGLLFLVSSMTLISYFPQSDFKKKAFKRAHFTSFNLLARWQGMVLRFHDSKNKPRHGIAVSNHTTPFDVLALSTDNCYSLTGQKHGGFIGILQRVLNPASPQIWFDRSSGQDREFVARRMREHVNDDNNPPILLFPEGTCINNTAVTQFKKGAFEVGATIYPVAIKYDPRYGDAFWNSSKQSASQHVFEMMTSWAIVGDVWYLPPVIKRPDETSVQFANRVKGSIAKKMDVIDLAWDGQVKRNKPKAEWKDVHKKLYYEKLKSRLGLAVSI